MILRTRCSGAWQPAVRPAAKNTTRQRARCSRRQSWRPYALANEHQPAAKDNNSSSTRQSRPSSSRTTSSSRPRGRGSKQSAGESDNASPAAAATATTAATAAPLSLTDSQLLRWERDGFIVTRRCLPAAAVLELKPEIESAIQEQKLAALRHRVRVLCPGVDPGSIKSTTEALRTIQRKGSDDLGFLQFFHMHRASDVVRRLVTGPALAGVAAQLLGVKRVRLFQDAGGWVGLLRMGRVGQYICPHTT